MAYSLVLPKEMINKIYKLREAKITKSIRAFLLVAIQDRIEFWSDELKEIEENERIKSTL